MGRHSSCIKHKLRKGLWSPEEDEKLFNYITRFGVGCWSSVPKLAGLQRCGKSCRLRWINYLRPDLKRGMFSQEEEDLILRLHEALGNRWAQISAQLPGRTDNEIKNFWNSCLKKKLMKQGIDPTTHKPLIAKVVEVKEEKNCAEKAKGSLPIVLSNFSTAHEEPGFIINETNNIYHGNGLTEGSREQFISKQVYTDPLSCFEYDQAAGYYNSSLAGLYHPTLRPNFDQNHHHQVLETCLNFEFSSMPSLTSFDHQGNMSSGTEFSDHNSGNSRMILNDQAAKESSSNSSNMSSYGGYNQQMNINAAAAAAAVFPWDGTDDDQKLEYSMFDQYHQVNGMIKTEVEPISPWHEVTVAGQFQADQINSSVHNFNSFPLRSLSQDLTGANLDVFHHQIIS